MQPPSSPDAARTARPARTLELDILRGLAALLIVVHHWRFLYFPAALPKPLSLLPLWPILEPLYVYGELIVGLFFTLSGYIFFWLFADDIAARRLSGKAFFQARFARLYPLFLATLVVVACLQPIFHAITGANLIYGDNTQLNFIRNLLMIQNWRIESHQTFNGPSWSLSTEVFLYILFFIVCRLRLIRTVHLLAFAIAGVWLQATVGQVATGVPDFFLGGLAFHTVRAMGPDTGRWRVPAIITVMLLWTITYIRADTAASLTFATSLPPFASEALKPLTALLTMSTFCRVVAPLTIIGLVIACRGHQEKLKPWAWLGDISYSVYLLHFPLMLAVSLAFSSLAKPDRYALASSPLSMAIFLIVLIGLAKLCHDRFEMPARDYLRWLVKRPLPPPAAPGHDPASHMR